MGMISSSKIPGRQSRSGSERYGRLLIRLSLGLLVATTAGCAEDPTTAAVGLPCLPYDEYSSTFPGFVFNETTIETSHVDCASESVCLVRHFQGRVSCPYGQDEAALETPEGDPRRCYVPRSQQEPVTVVVQPQLTDFASARGAYCSALCANGNGRRDDGRRYHECPAGFHCETIGQRELTNSPHLAGSYCVRNEASPVDPSSTLCQADATGQTGNCGSAKLWSGESGSE